MSPPVTSDSSFVPNPEQVEETLSYFNYLGGDEKIDWANAECAKALRLPSIISNRARAAKWRILQATALYLRFERTGQKADIDEAMGIFESIISCPDLGSLMQAHALYGLGRAFEALHEHDRSIGHSEIFECFQKARLEADKISDISSRILDEIEVHLGRSLLNLGFSGQGDSKSNLAAAKDMISKVAYRVQESDPLKPYALAYLSATHFSSWYIGARNNKDELAKSEGFIRQSLLLSSQHRHRYLYLRTLAGICMNLDKPHYVEEAIIAANEAMALLRTIPSVRVTDNGCVTILALAYQTRFLLKGRLEDLDVVVQYNRIAADSCGNEFGALSNLCQCLISRFWETGRLADIDDAIEAGQRALVPGAPSHAPQNVHLRLGLAHLSRFLTGDEHQDLEAAKSHLEVCLPGEMSPFLRPDVLINLARLYNVYFDVTAQPIHLDLAIDMGREAVAAAELIQANPIKMSVVLSQHAEHKWKRFGIQKDPRDFIESILAHEKAAQICPDVCSGRHSILYSYGRALRTRFELYHEQQDLEWCSAILQEAVDLAATSNLPHVSSYLHELATLHSASYAWHRGPNELNLSIGYYSAATHAVEGRTKDRLSAAIAGARFAQNHGQINQSFALFSAAISLLPRIAWIGLQVSKRHAKLVHTASQLACDAARSAVIAGQIERAVELLDEGRSVVWRSILELRTDLRLLDDVAPKLARELLEVAQALEHENLSTSDVSRRQAEERATRRRRTAERWEELVSNVRDLEGFESFLKPLPFFALRHAAKDGPIVLLNASVYGSDALIVSLNGPLQVIPLPGLDLTIVQRLAYMWLHTLRLPRDKEGVSILDRAMLEIFRELWYRGMATVAAALSNLQSQTPCCSRRVWWIPTSFLSLLPIHCAGPYEGDQPGIADLFISSYSTTLSALLEGRKVRDFEFGFDKLEPSARLLAVGLPETAGLPSLRFADTEMQIVGELDSFEHSFSYLYGPQATLDAMKRELPCCNWLHACMHGHWDSEEPLDSALQLTDGPLTLSHIVEMRLKSADFAFLSACHTARQAAVMPDESMHMVAGLQVAGFRGVLGTAWAMADRDGPLLAHRFYHWLAVDGRVPDATNAAEALHFAIKDLRGMGVPLHRWAAFVHFGI